MNEQTRSIEKTIEIRMPVVAVWKALTDAGELTRWFPLQAGEKENNIVWMAWGEEYYFESKTTIIDPPYRIKSIELPPKNNEGTRNTEITSEPVATDFQLESHEGKTILRLVHSGFSNEPLWDEMYEGTRRGWEFELRGLKHYLENHYGVPRKVIWVRNFFEMDLTDAWDRIMSSEGLIAEGSIKGLQEFDRYALKTKTGEYFEGIVHINNRPHDFCATIEGFNNALLRIRIDEYNKTRESNFWISTYGLSGDKVDDLQNTWGTLLSTLLS